jgi:hypothetical protein
MKIRPVGAALFNAGKGQTEADTKKLLVVFRDFVNAAESGKMSIVTGYHGTSKESVF